MSKLSIVRHGQASFFSDDYDKLSPMGEDQARALAKFWIENGVRVDEAYAGTLQRQTRTAEVVGETFREAGLHWPGVTTLPGLNEYDSDAMMSGLLGQLCDREESFRTLKSDLDSATESRARYRAFHRLLEAVMEVYIAGEYDATGFETWPEFRDRVRDALKQILSKPGSGRHAAVFTSGGPIGISVQTVLNAPDTAAAQLNWRVHNCSVTEFTFSGPRITLDAFNTIPHLLHDPDLLTYR